MDMIPQTEKKKTYVGRSAISYTMQNLQVISWQHQLENLEKYGYKFTIGEIENAANRIEPSQGPPLFEINDSFYSIQDFKILSEMVKNFLENKRQSNSLNGAISNQDLLEKIHSLNFKMIQEILSSESFTVDKAKYTGFHSVLRNACRHWKEEFYDDPQIAYWFVEYELI